MIRLPAAVNRKQLAPFLSLGFLIFTLGITSIVVQKIGEVQELRKGAAGEGYVSTLELVVVGKPSNNFAARPGDTFQVKVKLTPNQALSAVDVILDFDKSLLTLTDIVENITGNFKTFTPLTIAGAFDKEAVKTQANSGGVIRFGAATFDYAAEQTTDPQGLPLDPLATLTFRVNDGAAGTAKVSFGANGFKALGDTTDSNAVKYIAVGSSEAVVDILAQPTTTVQTTISLGISLASSVIPEKISDQATSIPIQVTITPTGATTPVFNQAVTFTRSSATFASSGITFEGATGSYQIKVKGPAHLSQTQTVQLSSSAVNQVAFTSQLLGGDLNGDDQVKLTDVGILVPIYGTTDATADINLDGKVNMYDVGFLVNNYGKVGGSTP